jgi:hypothetical protein
VERILKNDNMILKSNWFIDKNRMFDHEVQWYVLQDAKYKFMEKIKNNELSNFYEIIFHFLNMNTMLSNNSIFDEHMNIITKDPELKRFIKNLDSAYKDGKQIRNTETTKIITSAKKTFFEIMNTYIDSVLTKYGNLKLAWKNDQIHNEDIIFILLKVESSDYYDLWKIDLTEGKGFGELIRIKDFKKDNIMSNFIMKYNSDNNDKINEDNLIIVQMEKADSHDDVMYMMRDIIMLNKFFTLDNPFDENIFEKTKAILEKNKTFPFSLVRL